MDTPLKRTMDESRSEWTVLMRLVGAFGASGPFYILPLCQQQRRSVERLHCDVLVVQRLSRLLLLIFRIKARATPRGPFFC